MFLNESEINYDEINLNMKYMTNIYIFFVTLSNRNTHTPLFDPQTLIKVWTDNTLRIENTLFFCQAYTTIHQAQ